MTYQSEAIYNNGVAGRTPRKLTQIRFTDREKEMLATIAELEQVSMSEIVRLLVRQRYEEEIKKEKSPPK